jgi:hypothetical protein
MTVVQGEFRPVVVLQQLPRLTLKNLVPDEPAANLNPGAMACRRVQCDSHILIPKNHVSDRCSSGSEVLLDGRRIRRCVFRFVLQISQDIVAADRDGRQLA